MNVTVLKTHMIDLIAFWHQVVESKGINYPLPDNLDALEVSDLRMILMGLYDIVRTPV